MSFPQYLAKDNNMLKSMSKILLESPTKIELKAYCELSNSNIIIPQMILKYKLNSSLIFSRTHVLCLLAFRLMSELGCASSRREFCLGNEGQ